MFYKTMNNQFNRIMFLLIYKSINLKELKNWEINGNQNQRIRRTLYEIRLNKWNYLIEL